MYSIISAIMQLYMTVMGALFRVVKRLYKKTFWELKQMKEEK